MDNIVKPLLKNVEYEKCCTSFYENDMVKFLLGDSFHPGGIKLTNKLANKLELIRTLKFWISQVVSEHLQLRLLKILKFMLLELI